jgi:N-acetyl sugar amidotransferase
MVSYKSDPAYRQCAITVMDNIADPDIVFDEKGICNYYHEYREAEKNLFTERAGEIKLQELANEISIKGKGRKYDCLIGLSGGVDSTYVAYLVKRLGLRPLAVHLDNGWNSELAVKNIENVINKLNIDLFTLVVNWQEFKDIQLSYLKASVVDIEVVSDHAITATMYKLAKQHSISYIISGTNIVTEHIMPPSWLYKKMDFANLRDIHNQFGQVKIKTYPHLDFKRYVYYSAALRLTPISILNYVPYNKQEIKQIITKELDWRDYGGKHYESIFTKFYQAYILPEKFKIDKRKAHLSTGQMTKEAALSELELPLYNAEELKRDTEYVLKKFGLKASEFESIMQAERRGHEEFETDAKSKRYYMRFLERTKKLRKGLKETFR